MWHSGFGKHAAGRLEQVYELRTGRRWVSVEREVGEEPGLVTRAKAGWWEVVAQVAW